MSKFNVGDRVKVLCLDDMSTESMIEYVGKIGIVKTLDEKDYGILFEDDYYEHICWWFRESSLEFAVDSNLINTDSVLYIILKERGSHPEAIKVLDKIIYEIGVLSCK